MSVPASRLADAPSAKIVLLGESAVGKSSISLRFARNEFSNNQETTIGAAYLSRTVLLPPATPAAASQRALKFEIWDTAGQERYRSLAPIYYRGACGALVVYDVTSSESLRKARTWIKELRANADPTLVLFLVGNKRDLESLRQVSAEEGRAAAVDEEVAGFYEVSAKENTGVEQLFMDLAAKLLDHGLTNVSTGMRPGGVRTLDAPAQQPAAGAGQGGMCC